MTLKRKNKIVQKLADRVLAETLARLDAYPWQLAIIGDGAARADIDALKAPLGEDRVRFLEQRETDELPGLLNTAGLMCCLPSEKPMAWPFSRHRQPESQAMLAVLPRLPVTALPAC